MDAKREAGPVLMAVCIVIAAGTALSMAPWENPARVLVGVLCILSVLIGAGFAAGMVWAGKDPEQSRERTQGHTSTETGSKGETDGE